MDGFPRTTADVTADWLTQALRQGGTIPDSASVASITADPTAAGVGFMGEVGRISVTYAGTGAEGAPTTMMVKFPTASPEVMTMMHPTRVYEREHRFYGEIAKQSPVRTPDLYHVTCETSEDPSAERYVLVLEDLSALTEGDQVSGLSPEQTESALRGLAAHHARFWDENGLAGVDFLPQIDGPLNMAGESIYQASLPGFLEVFGHLLEPEMRRLAEAYGPNHPRLLRRFAAMPHTLVHFDFRADNLFFDTDGSVVVIDWQSISIGGGASDVGYLMGQNLSLPDRKAHEADLLHAYHDTLVANGVTGYDYDQFFQDYRVGVVYGWVIPVFAVGSLDASSERAMTLWTRVIERVQDAIFDHGAQEFIEGM